MTEKVALISGAYRGLGLEAAKELAAKGWCVVLTARKNAPGEKAAGAIRAAGGNAEFIAMDVSDGASVTRAAQAFSAKHDRLDALINNAAILGDSAKPMTETSAEEVEETLRTNTLGAIRVIQAFLPPLLAARGRIVNVSSGEGSLAEMGSYAPAYSISKTALNAVTRKFATALKEKGVSINSACPGWVRTEMGGASAPRSVEEGADTIVWLASEAPADLTGQFLRDRKPAAW